MPSAAAETKELNGITIACDGNGTYSISGTASASAYTQISFDVSEFTSPISVGAGGNGTLSLFNTFANGSVFVNFYNGNTRVDDWVCTPAYRTNTKYVVVGGKIINKLTFAISSGVSVNGSISIMFTNDGQLPSEFVPHLIFKDWFYRKRETATDTITTLPKQIIGDGQSASAVIKGNLSQSGTPTPANPIYPIECGDRTANLYNWQYMFAYIDSTGKIIENAANILAYAEVEPNTTYTVSADLMATNGNRIAVFDTVPTANLTGSNVISISQGAYLFTITTNNDTKYIAWHTNFSDNNRFTKFVQTSMLNTGETALPFEPYGYKLPIKSGSTTTPVYLGEVQSTRQIVKTVLTSSTNVDWAKSSSRNYAWYFTPGAIGVKASTPFLCSHGATVTSVSEYVYGTVYCDNTVNLGIFPSTLTTVNSVKAWLDEQDANGTPVIIWNVLSTSRTTTLNEPLRKIDNYADSVSVSNIPTTGTAEQFDVDTTLKPSEVQLTYHGWHEHSDTKY